ncbi:MAG: hypothetical protein JWM98_2025 [Thermoleophilia bacterium]|nr:hypothetical protein [Thermoleophilia bacterium]
MGGHADYQEIPEHVRRIIDRDGEIEFTPPSFERWLGRLQMVRTLTAMAAFLVVWLTFYAFGQPWEGATVRGIVAAIVFFFFSWAAGLLVFGELYDAEVKAARVDLEAKERERARRIEEYYRERLRAQAESGIDHDHGTLPGGYVPSLGDNRPASAGPTPVTQPMPAADTVPDYQRRAA